MYAVKILKHDLSIGDLKYLVSIPILEQRHTWISHCNSPYKYLYILVYPERAVPIGTIFCADKIEGILSSYIEISLSIEDLKEYLVMSRLFQARFSDYLINKGLI